MAHDIDPYLRQNTSNNENQQFEKQTFYDVTFPEDNPFHIDSMEISDLGNDRLSVSLYFSSEVGDNAYQGAGSLKEVSPSSLAQANAAHQLFRDAVSLSPQLNVNEDESHVEVELRYDDQDPLLVLDALYLHFQKSDPDNADTVISLLDEAEFEKLEREISTAIQQQQGEKPQPSL